MSSLLSFKASFPFSACFCAFFDAFDNRRTLHNQGQGAHVAATCGDIFDRTAAAVAAAAAAVAVAAAAAAAAAPSVPTRGCSHQTVSSNADVAEGARDNQSRRRGGSSERERDESNK